MRETQQDDRPRHDDHGGHGRPPPPPPIHDLSAEEEEGEVDGCRNTDHQSDLRIVHANTDGPQRQQYCARGAQGAGDSAGRAEPQQNAAVRPHGAKNSMGFALDLVFARGDHTSVVLGDQAGCAIDLFGVGEKKDHDDGCHGADGGEPESSVRRIGGGDQTGAEQRTNHGSRAKRSAEQRERPSPVGQRNISGEHGVTRQAKGGGGQPNEKDTDGQGPRLGGE